jgi:heme A synthase
MDEKSAQCWLDSFTRKTQPMSTTTLDKPEAGTNKPAASKLGTTPVNGRFLRYAWGVLGLNVLVIVWGAFVRATGSGAGCGSHWPLCNGEVIPQAPQLETMIEFSHRITSGLALLAVLALVVWGFRAYPKGHGVRKGVVWTGIFMILEALIGAALVLLEYTAFNVSVGRALWMALHLINTFLLLAALVLTVWWAQGGARLKLRGHGVVGLTFWLLVGGMLLLGASGAITALGDTLTITGGLSPQEYPLVATLVELRILHPIIAFVVFGLALLSVWTANRGGRANADMHRYGQAVVILFIVQLLVGALNVQLRAPVWLQLVHLLFTSVIWMLVVFFGAATLSNRKPQPAAREGAYAEASA